MRVEDERKAVRILRCCTPDTRVLLYFQPGGRVVYKAKILRPGRAYINVEWGIYGRTSYQPATPYRPPHALETTLADLWRFDCLADRPGLAMLFERGEELAP